MKIKNKLIGKLGEEIAVNYLLSNGYKILDRNFSKKFAEIDIIATKNSELVIVEVKTRKNKDISNAESAVNLLKQSKIKKLALIYLQEENIYDINIRFDIIECYWENKKINHIIDAFWGVYERFKRSIIVL